jgi:hypothetical protein
VATMLLSSPPSMSTPLMVRIMSQSLAPVRYFCSGSCCVDGERASSTSNGLHARLEIGLICSATLFSFLLFGSPVGLGFIRISSSGALVSVAIAIVSVAMMKIMMKVHKILKKRTG